MKKMNIVLKIILPLIVGLIVIAIVSIYTNFFLLEKHISNKSKETSEIINNSLKIIIKQDTDLMLGLIEQLEKDQNTIQLFTENNKKELYSYLKDTYISYRERYGITHFYIHKVNKVNFLRVHNKEKHSDVIQRTTLDNASKSLKMSSGIEFGILHNLTLRVVLPWFVDGKLIGYLELGKEVDQLTPRLLSGANADIIFTINRKFISEENFLKWKNSNTRNRHYEKMQSFYVIDSTVDTIDTELQTHIDDVEIHPNHYLENMDKKYFVNTSSLLDLNNQEVGHINVLIDMTDEYMFLCELILKVSGIVLSVIVLMLIYYYRFLRNKESELNLAYSEIQRISITDGLTSLYNKRHYLDNAPKQINNCSRCNSYISFILIDVDNFKKYNDNYGHLQGDKVLSHISKSMQEIFKRTSDYSYRVGGEEFLVVTSSKDQDNGYKMANILLKEIENLQIEHAYSTNKKVVTISIGVCTVRADLNTNLNELYDNADRALYKSKVNGRNQVTVF